MKTLKTVLEALFFCLLFSVAGFMAPLEAHSQEIATGSHPEAIKVVGHTKDGKYPIYLLEGDYNDLSWHSGKVEYNSWDLVGQMNYIKIEDIGHPYKCGFVCKDIAKNIVGLNPKYKATTAELSKR